MRGAPGSALLRRVPVLATAALAVGVLAAAALVGCSAAPASHAAQASHSRAVAPAIGGASGTKASAPAKTPAAVPACDPYASSLRPLGPAQVTPGSWMATIRKRGYLVAGVDQNTFHFEYFNPLDGQFEGFDIDMIRAVAQAIFGNPNQVRYKAITDDARTTDIIHGTVDIVAHTMTINCKRLLQVDFSTVYFDAHQQVLVLKNSTITGVDGLAGQKVCATTGSDSVGRVEAYHPRIVEVPYITDCLVQLQQGQVAAITTDNTILEGLEAQDPFTKIVGPYLSDEPYGLAISKDHPEFVRFVNAVLAHVYKDDAWEKSYNHWVSPSYVKPPVPEYAN